MKLDYELLAESLRALEVSYGRGVWAEMKRRSGISNVSRIANGIIKPKMETWAKLHSAFPDDIPAPSLEQNATVKEGTLFLAERLKRAASTLQEKMTDIEFDQMIKEYEKETDKFQLVPKYKAKLSGGPGSLETSDQIDANLMFRREFLDRKGPIDQMALFEVTGESMQPFIYHGDVVLVDMSTNSADQIVSGKTYAFRENSTVLIKRLSCQGAAIIAASENHQMHPPYHIDLESFQLIGRVIWVGHEVR